MADNFLFYKSWWDIIHQCVPENKRKEFLYEIVRYGITGDMNTAANEMFMLQVKAQIDNAKSKHDKRVEAGRKGGKSGKGEAKARYGNKNASKTQPNENDNVNDNENDNIILSSPSLCTHSDESCILGDRKEENNKEDYWLTEGWDDE